MSKIFQIVDIASSDIRERKEVEEEPTIDNPESKKKYISYKRYEIRLYGISRSGKTICCRVSDFKPYFFIEVPEPLSEIEITSFKNSIKTPLKEFLGKEYARRISEGENAWFQNVDDLLEEIADIANRKRKKFYNFTNNKLFSFLGIKFHSANAFYTFRRFFEKVEYLDFFQPGTEKFKLQLYESNLDPLLRFCHIRNISPSGWVKVKQAKTVRIDNTTKAMLECMVKYFNVEQFERNKIAPFLIASFDIECSSNDGSFPNPDNPKDRVIQIGTTFHRYGMKKCSYKNIVVLGKCDEIEGVDVEEAYSEGELIYKWCKMMERMQPSIITGYNIWGFDWLFLYKKAINLGEYMGIKVVQFFDFIDYKINKNNRERKLIRKKLQSAAMGHNLLSYFTFEGIVQIDLYKFSQTNFKLDSYKLNNVAKTFLKEEKVDLSPQELFKNFRIGTPDKIKEIAVYCVQDCALVNNLIIKLEVIANNIGMSNVCSIPLSYLFLRGQGIKIFSLVVKQCRKEGYLIKVVKKEKNSAGYEGAIVLTPKPGIYFEPVSVLDYASLYPSSMIAENISHDSMVCHKYYNIELDEDGNPEIDDETGKIVKGKLDKIIADGKEYKTKEEYLVGYPFDNLKNYQYNNVEYNLYEGEGKEKRVNQICVCRYAEGKEKSVLPRILNYLLKARKSTRKKIKYKTLTLKNGKEIIGLYSSNEGKVAVIQDDGDKWEGKENNVVEIKDTYTDFEKAVWDGLQVAYKVTANSLYGQVGASTSPICLKQLAASTTAVGREQIILAKEYCEDPANYPFKLSSGKTIYLKNKTIYGDSVTGDTPLILRNKEGQVIIKTIESLSDEWKPYEEFKPFDTNRREKQQAKTNYEIWTNGKWANIHRVIRHKTKKRIFRVNTHCGVVDVTEDHSLLNSKLEKN